GQVHRHESKRCIDQKPGSDSWPPVCRSNPDRFLCHREVSRQLFHLDSHDIEVLRAEMEVKFSSPTHSKTRCDGLDTALFAKFLLFRPSASAQRKFSPILSGGRRKPRGSADP